MGSARWCRAWFPTDNSKTRCRFSDPPQQACLVGEHHQLLSPVSNVGHNGRVTSGFTAGAPENLAALFVERRAMCADIDEQRAADDQRRAGETPRWSFGPGFRGDIFLPDNVAVGRIQTDQHSVLAQRIHAIAIDGGCAARTTIIILRIELGLVERATRSPCRLRRRNKTRCPSPLPCRVRSCRACKRYRWPPPPTRNRYQPWPSTDAWGRHRATWSTSRSSREIPFRSGPRQRTQSRAHGLAKLPNKPSDTKPIKRSRTKLEIMAAMGKQLPRVSQTTKTGRLRLDKRLKS